MCTLHIHTPTKFSIISIIWRFQNKRNGQSPPASQPTTRPAGYISSQPAVRFRWPTLIFQTWTDEFTSGFEIRFHVRASLMIIHANIRRFGAWRFFRRLSNFPLLFIENSTKFISFSRTEFCVINSSRRMLRSRVSSHLALLNDDAPGVYF